MSRPPARHQKPPQQSPARLDQYDGPHNEAPYSGNPYNGRYDDSPYAEAQYHDGRYGGPLYDRPYSEPGYDDRWYGESQYNSGRHAEAPFDGDPYAEAPYDGSPNTEAPYADGPYAEAQYDGGSYARPQYDDGPYGEAPYRDGQHGESQYNNGPYDQRAHGDAGPDQRASDRRRPPRDRGAHRHARPSRKRRKPVKIAAAMAGSTLLVAGAVPVAAHWWHRPATHPTALDQENPAGTPGAVVGGGAQTSSGPAAPENALDQWAKIPIGKHAASQVRAAKRAAAARPPAPRPKPKATPAAAYQNPLRDVSGLVLERVDMGVDFGGAGPVFALGDGVITNATGDSTGWPGGGYITYQLTDGPDAGLVVYLAEDVKPTVQVGQKVTSSIVIANMFNGGDGIETGWATSDSSTAESQTAAAGGISGNGPFPTMVGLSFDAVLESVGVPAAPNASEPGNGLLPAGYPPT